MKLLYPEQTSEIFVNLLKEPFVVDFLSAVRDRDIELYVHSINVCFLALDLGVDYGFPEKDLNTLGIVALFHDVSKLGSAYNSCFSCEIGTRGFNKVLECLNKVLSDMTEVEIQSIQNSSQIDYQLLVESLAHYQCYKVDSDGNDGISIQRGISSVFPKNSYPKSKKDFLAQIVCISNLCDLEGKELHKRHCYGDLERMLCAQQLKKNFIGGSFFIDSVLQRI